LVLLLVSSGLRAEVTPGTEAAARIADAGAALDRGELEAAEQGFLSALESAPENPIAWLGLAETRERQGDFVEALRAARRAVQIAPDLAPARLVTGRLLVRVGATDEALEAFSMARDLDPGQPASYLLPALVLRNVNRGVEAIDLLESAQENGVDTPEIAVELGLLLLDEGRSDHALEITIASQERHPQHGGLKMVEGLALATDEEQREVAVARLEEALSLETNHEGKVQLELGGLLVDLGRAAEAIPHLEAAAELLPEEPEVHYRLGAALRSTGDLTGARAALLEFQEMKRELNAVGREDLALGTALNQAQSLALDNRLDEALAAVQTLIEEHPDEARPLALRAKIHFSLGRVSEAVNDIIRARELRPDRVEYHYLEGVFLFESGQAVEAVQALGRGLAVDDTSAPIYQLLGLIAVDRGADRIAVQLFEKAISFGSEDPTLEREYAAAVERLNASENGESASGGGGDGR